MPGPRKKKTSVLYVPGKHRQLLYEEGYGHTHTSSTYNSYMIWIYVNTNK